MKRCITVALVGLSFVWATWAHADSIRTIEAEGWADIEKNQVSKARDSALQNAQMRAVQVVAGVYVESMMKDESYSKVHGKKDQFKQIIEQRVFTKTKGYIRNYRIIKEGKVGGTFRAKLSVDVEDAALKERLARIAAGLSRARYPKMMFIVQERYKNKDGKSEFIPKSTLQSLLEDALLEEGFDLVDKSYLDELRGDEAAIYLKDNDKAAKLAMKYGAEYIISASAETAFKDYNAFGQKSYAGSTRLSLKAVNASTAGVVASTEKGGASPPAFSEQELRMKAVRAFAPKLVDNFLGRVLEAWDKDTSRGTRYFVKLHNVKNYRKHGRAFMKVIEGIEGVQNLKRLTYAENRLELELLYPAEHDASHLENAILDAVGGDNTFKSLDVSFSRGSELNFKL